MIIFLLPKALKQIQVWDFGKKTRWDGFLVIVCCFFLWDVLSKVIQTVKNIKPMPRANT